MPSPRVRSTAAAAILLGLLAANAPGQPTESTAVEGDVPADLAGRWLVVEQSRLVAGGTVQPFVRLWDMQRGPEHLELVLRRTRLPESVAAKLAAAGGAGGPWTPDNEDLHETAERWDDLPPSSAEVQRIDHRLSRPAHDAESGGDGLEIVTEEGFAGTRPLRGRRSVYTVRERDTTRLSGSFVTVSELDTPTRLTITLRGEFQAYRLPAVPPRSWLRRALDTLLGRYEAV
jgi:hypothetical protein